MFDGADTVVLYEELAFQAVLPVQWRPTPNPTDREAAAAFADRNVRLLQAWDAMEEHGPSEKADENSPAAADLMRLELKVNLLLDLVGQILASSRPKPVAVPARLMPWAPSGAMHPGPCPRRGPRGSQRFISTTPSPSHCGCRDG